MRPVASWLCAAAVAAAAFATASAAPATTRQQCQEDGDAACAAAAARDGRCSSLRAATWNVAAINNNPFEYWITYDNADYRAMMEAVQDIVISPGVHDVPVHEVFTDGMFAELGARMRARGWAHVDDVEAAWRADFRERRIVSGFLKDKLLGKKRLASMPDRTTNTINTDDRGAVYRPSVINCYAGGALPDTAAWWRQWQEFMFESAVTVRGERVDVADLLVPIKRSKYPLVTEAEEAMSIPLQALAAAIFDAVLVHLLNSVAPSGKWEAVRANICERLNLRKTERTLEILETPAYAGMDVVFMQEVASSFIAAAEARPAVADAFHVLRPARLAKRDQNSLVLVRKDRFDAATAEERTELVEGFLSDDAPVALGDVFGVVVRETEAFSTACGFEAQHREEYFFVSFHGDTNGLATLPVLGAVHKAEKYLEALRVVDDGQPRVAPHAAPRMVFGLDANVYEACAEGKTLCAAGKGKYQGVREFISQYKALGYASCWGPQADADGAAETFRNRTTFTVRTYLQPQLNKAAKSSELHLRGDVNPKDFILFRDSHLHARSAAKDNTGDGPGHYLEDTVFPTLAFPSDHGILSMDANVLPRPQ